MIFTNKSAVTTLYVNLLFLYYLIITTRIIHGVLYHIALHIVFMIQKFAIRIMYIKKKKKAGHGGAGL